MVGLQVKSRLQHYSITQNHMYFPPSREEAPNHAHSCKDACNMKSTRAILRAIIFSRAPAEIALMHGVILKEMLQEIISPVDCPCQNAVASIIKSIA